MNVHFLDTDAYTFTGAERRLVSSLATESIGAIRAHLSCLPERLHLLVEAGDAVIDVTGELGFALAPHAIRWTVDPERNVAEVARAHLRHALAHECHHAARLMRLPGEAYMRDWRSGCVFEGLATVFERDVAGFEPP